MSHLLSQEEWLSVLIGWCRYNCVDFLKMEIHFFLPHINMQEICGGTALFFATLYGNNTCSDILLQNGANPNIADYSGVTPLYIATVNNDIAMGCDLLKYGADPNMSVLSRNGQYPIHVAVKNSNTQFVIVLVFSGANLDVADSEGRSAIWYAADRGDLVITKILIKNGADLTRVDRVVSAIQNARARGHLVVARCIEKEANWARRKSLLYVYLGLNARNKDIVTNYSNQYAIRTFQCYDTLRLICLFL